MPLVSSRLLVYTENIEFEWDSNKEKSNRNKHGVNFRSAITVFDDPNARLVTDAKHSQIEQREWIIGESDQGILVIIFTKRRGGRIYRIISARRANRQERKEYEKFKEFPF